MTEFPSRRLEIAQQQFHRVEVMIRLLGPDATLRRGYSITTDTAGKIIRSVSNVSTGASVRTRVSDGTFDSEVIGDAKPAPDR